MNTFRLLALTSIGIVTLLAAQKAKAQTNYDATANASIVDTLTIEEDEILDFGTFAIVNPADMGSFTVNANGTINSLVNVQHFGQHQRGEFSIDAGGSAVTASVSCDALPMTLAGPGGAEMLASLSVANPDGTSQTQCNDTATLAVTITGDPGGTPVVTYGNIAFQAGQTPGNYTGIYTLTAAFGM